MLLAACAGPRPAPVVASVSTPVARPDLAATALQQALEHLPDGQALQWRSEDGAASGIIAVERTYQDATGAYCRSFRQTATDVAGASTQARSACRTAAGEWRVVPG
jgi:surface antigen